jgi:hypothetical protein
VFARLLGRRRVRVLLVVPVLVLAGLVGQSGPAAAAKWYCGDACNFKDPSKFPVGNPCANDAVTVSSVEARGRTLQLRYSNNCETVWARLFGGQGGEKVQFYTSQGSWRGDWENFTPDNWSPMVDDHNIQIRACISQHWGEAPWACTGYY